MRTQTSNQPAPEYIKLLTAYGVPGPGAHVAGVVEDAFCSGTFDHDAAAETAVIDLKDPTVWAIDPLAALELTVTGSEFDAWLAAYGFCVEFLEGEVFDADDASLIAQVAEGLFIEIEDGGSTRRFRCGMSIAGKPTGQLYTGDPAAATNGWDWSKRSFPEIVPFAIDLRKIKSAKLVATAAATGDLISADASVRLHTRGLLVSTNTVDLPGQKGTGQACHVEPLKSVAVAKGQSKRAIMTLK